MNQTRTTVGLLFPGVGALVALIGVSVGGSPRTLAQAQAPSPWLEISRGQAAPARPTAKVDAIPHANGATATATAIVAAAGTETGTGTEPEAEPAKVHGTITVDFEKVTIAELLRLTKTLEQVDGVIHIVSARGGEGIDGAVVTVARPGSAALVLGEREAVQRARAQYPAAAAPPRQRSSATPFPRLASLGRMLGLHPSSSAAPDPRAGAVAVTWEPRPGAVDAANVARVSHEAPAFQPPAPLDLMSADIEPAPPAAPAAAAAPTGEAPAVPPTEEAAADPPTEEAPADPPTEEAPADPPTLETAAPAPSLSPSPAAAAGPRQHVAAAGDSFEGLSRSFYGDARYARALWWANRADVAWPGALSAGKRLIIPAPGELEPRMIVAPDPVGVASSPKPSATETRVDPDVQPASFNNAEPAHDQEKDKDKEEDGGFSVHVVRPDDTLRVIAREVCGDERKALEIIALNRDILTPEGRIRVGQRLLMPAPAEKPTQQ